MNAAPAAPARERLAELGAVAGNARRAFGLVWQTSRRLAAALVGLTVVDATLPVSIAWVGKHLIDAVVAAAASVGAHGESADAALRAAVVAWVLAELALMLLRSATLQATALAQTLLRTGLAQEVNVRILEKALHVSYRRFEDPGFNDRLSQARREASSRPLDAVRSLLAIGRSAVALAGYSALLAGFSGWAVLVLLASAVPPVIAEARHGRAAFVAQRARTFRNRQAHYLEVLLSNEASAKEVKLFALGEMLLGRFRAFYQAFRDEDEALARGRAGSALALGALATLALYGCTLWIVLRAAAGEISIGAMTLYVVVFREGQGAFQSGMLALARLYEDNLFLTNLFEYLAIPDDEPFEAIPAADGGADELVAPPPRLVLESVGFRYPGAARDSIHDLTLTIEPGETLALVGPNGAGKTTLVKLLTGLYRPTAGRITLGGRDLVDIPRGELRSLIGVIFQDFVRFHFTIADNVGVGWLPDMADRERIARAGAAGGIAAEVARLPRGWDEDLGRWFGGTELSVGQWQRLALSRAFMRRSPVLILDEPTAALDAEAEHEIFQRFRELTAGRTAIVITHRFSTVRVADRIAVLEAGRLTELGTHRELLERDGRYASLFRLQAAGYRDD